MIIAPQPHTLTVAGTQLSTFGMYQSGNKTFASAEKDLEFVEIPGKSGDLVIDRNRFRNITREYDCFIVSDDEADFRTKIRNLADFLGSLRTYARIEDTYHPNEFVMGIPEASKTFGAPTSRWPSTASPSGSSKRHRRPWRPPGAPTW